MEEMTQSTLLALFAHPDDESFGCGGALARLADEGHRVVLVCATRGELGEISDPALATPENLGEVREQELRNAADALGISEVIFLDYRDSGMAGTEGNNDSRAFSAQPPDVVVRQLVGIIRRERPGAILTFEPNGGYGHPDHIAMHHNAMAAVSAAGVGAYAPDMGRPWRTPRVWWSVIPQQALRGLRDAMVTVGMESDWAEELIESGAGWPDDDVDLNLDVAAWADKKWRSFEAHATQFGEDSLFRRAKDALGDAILGQETFVLAIGDKEPTGTLIAPPTGTPS